MSTKKGLCSASCTFRTMKIPLDHESILPWILESVKADEDRPFFLVFGETEDVLYQFSKQGQTV